ncbi:MULTISPECIES: hypothetical protein [unclassified Streptomyces]|uniref:hypothetical protein n=1 Tax=unclassified Streptomyces TaxID=2593676 RepID=UPI0035DFF46B
MGLDVQEVLEAARQCPWALTDPQHFLVSDASEEITLVTLQAVRDHERSGYTQRLELAEQRRSQLETTS